MYWKIRAILYASILLALGSFEYRPLTHIVLPCCVHRYYTESDRDTPLDHRTYSAGNGVQRRRKSEIEHENDVPQVPPDRVKLAGIDRAEVLRR